MSLKQSWRPYKLMFEMRKCFCEHKVSQEPYQSSAHVALLSTFTHVVRYICILYPVLDIYLVMSFILYCIVISLQ